MDAAEEAVKIGRVPENEGTPRGWRVKVLNLVAALVRTYIRERTTDFLVLLPAQGFLATYRQFQPEVVARAGEWATPRAAGAATAQAGGGAAAAVAAPGAWAQSARASDDEDSGNESEIEDDDEDEDEDGDGDGEADMDLSD